MIDYLTYVPRDESSMPWAADVERLKRDPRIEFAPGLNIVFGANGSGKSTVAQLLATSLAAAKGGVSTVTSSWLQDSFGFRSKQLNIPCEVVHDGQPIMFFDARAKEGIIGGSFDDDFFNLGIANTMARGSTGQLAYQRMERMLKVLLKKDVPPPATAADDAAPAPARRGKSFKDFERKGGFRNLIPAGFPNEIAWQVPRAVAAHGTFNERTAQAEELLRAKRPLGPKTLIFDEPESGYSLPWQAGLWDNIFAKVDPNEFQLIVVTHSPFALDIQGAHYIEMTPGYIADCLASTRKLMNRLSPKESAL